MLAVPDYVADAVKEAKTYSVAKTLCAVNYAGDNFDEDALDKFFTYFRVFSAGTEVNVNAMAYDSAFCNACIHFAFNGDIGA